MILSLPVINTIRFDTDLTLIVNRAGVNTQSLSEGYCFDESDDEGNKRYGIGIRIRLNFYVDKTVNEAAGYLSETESIILNHSTPIEDMDMLKGFSEDVFRSIKRNLQDALPAFDLKSIEFSDPIKMAYYFSDGFIQLGLYK